MIVHRSYSGAPATQRAAKRSPIPIYDSKVIVIIMASGTAPVRVRTTTTESRNIAAIL